MICQTCGEDGAGLRYRAWWFCARCWREFRALSQRQLEILVESCLRSEVWRGRIESESGAESKGANPLTEQPLTSRSGCGGSAAQDCGYSTTVRPRPNNQSVAIAPQRPGQPVERGAQSADH